MKIRAITMVVILLLQINRITTNKAIKEGYEKLMEEETSWTTIINLNDQSKIIKV